MMILIEGEPKEIAELLEELRGRPGEAATGVSVHGGCYAPASGGYAPAATTVSTYGFGTDSISGAAPEDKGGIKTWNRNVSSRKRRRS
jgi:hypothetical protein